MQPAAATPEGPSGVMTPVVASMCSALPLYTSARIVFCAGATAARSRTAIDERMFSSDFMVIGGRASGSIRPRTLSTETGSSEQKMKRDRCRTPDMMAPP